MTGRVTCLIVEDQRPAQRILEGFIRDVPHLDLMGTCGSAMEAMALLQGRGVDLMFLDLHLPRLGGFDFLRSLPRPPQVVVTTAFAEHALEGYELDVVDYLLKPFGFERFLRAVAKVRRPEMAPSAPAPSHPPPAPPVTGMEPNCLFVRLDGEHRRVDLADIVYLEAQGDYVNLYTPDARLFLSGTLSGWEDRLPPARFLRVHKSYLVNVARVDRIAGSDLHTCRGMVPLGRSFRDRVMARLTGRPEPAGHLDAMVSDAED